MYYMVSITDRDRLTGKEHSHSTSSAALSILVGPMTVRLTTSHVVGVKMRREEKAIFIGGTSKSGKTPLRLMLDHHSQLQSFAGTSLLTHELFRQFPDWLVGQPRDVRVVWVDLYRRMCLTRFLCFRVPIRGKHVGGIWLKIDRSWMRRFHESKATWWERPWGRWAEDLWLTGPVQSRRRFLRQPTRGTGYRGLGFPALQQNLWVNFGSGSAPSA